MPNSLLAGYDTGVVVRHKPYGVRSAKGSGNARKSRTKNTASSDGRISRRESGGLPTIHQKAGLFDTSDGSLWPQSRIRKGELECPDVSISVELWRDDHDG